MTADLTVRLTELYDQDDYGGPALHSAIEAVLKLHVPDRPSDRYPNCSECSHGCGVGDVDWPCSTVAAITEELM